MYGVIMGNKMEYGNCSSCEHHTTLKTKLWGANVCGCENRVAVNEWFHYDYHTEDYNINKNDKCTCYVEL